MTRPRIVLGVLALVATGAWLMLLPPPAIELTVSGTSQRPVRGSLHIHTRQSDGTGTIDDVAAAAAKAGLSFVVVTDHGDATREPAPPAYRFGVLCIDAVEISTDGGHLVALGLPRSPYRLAGSPRDVVEDVHRMGGFAIAAHPESAKSALRWRDNDIPVDGIEWLNADSEWRDDAAWRLFRTLLTYPARPVGSILHLIDRPENAIARWDLLMKERRVVGLAAADAHARLGLRGSAEPYDNTASLPMPGYEQMFRLFSVTLASATLNGDATRDARIVLDEIRSGHVYSTLDGVATPAQLSVSATSGAFHAEQGDALALGGPVALRVRSNAPADSTIVLFRNGQMATTKQGSALDFAASAESAIFRVEVHRPEHRAPWLVSNPIYVGQPAAPETIASPAASVGSLMRYDEGSAAEFAIEKSEKSQAAIDVVAATPSGTQLLFRFALGGSESEHPYAAVALAAGPDLASYSGLAFRARASRPMRLSVQARVPAGSEDRRWRRSVYIDPTVRDITIPFEELTAVPPVTPAAAPLAQVGSLLFVVDTVNAAPGTAGQLWLDRVRYVK